MLPVRAIQPMKRVIRNIETGKFFKDGAWVNDMSDATDFKSIPEAVRACHRYNLKNTELVLCFQHPEMDLSMPICGP